MEWRKVKNMIVLLLLVVNGFLLVLVVARQNESRQYEQAALTQAIQALSNSGIAVDAAALTPVDDLPPVAAEWDAAQEEQLISALLDEAVAGDNRGGGLSLYRGSAGEVSFRPGGELSATLWDTPRWHTDHPAAHAAGLLHQMRVDGEQLALTEAEGATTVTFRQLWDGVPLFSCQITFTYRDGRLQAINGTLLVSGRVSRQPGQVLTLPTALLRFLDNILESGDVCSAILSMEAGYRPVQSLSSSVYLSPTWLISSNTANYYMDAVTGTLTRISER